MQPVYSAGRQLLKVRLVMWASVVALAICVWQGYELAQSYGLRAADGGQLAPLAVRAAWGAGLVVLGLACFAGMWMFGARYVAAIRVDDVNRLVEIDTLRFFGRRTATVPASSVHLGRSHAGHLRTRGTTVNAPWSALRVDGLRRSLILDHQGTVVDAGFPSLLREAAQSGVGRRGAS